MSNEVMMESDLPMQNLNMQINNEECKTPERGHNPMASTNQFSHIQNIPDEVEDSIME